MAPTLHIAVNSRLTQLLKQQLLADRWAQQTVVETPNVMTGAQWWLQWEQQHLLAADLAELSALFEPKRLSVFEAERLWESVLTDAIQQQPELSLLNPAATAKQLYQAWCFLVEYEAESALKQAFQTAEVKLFLTLKQAYQNRLTECQLLDPPLLHCQRLAQFAKAPLLTGVSEVVLHGFDEITPFMQKWLALLEAQGIAVQQRAAPPLSQAPSQQWLAAQTAEEEAQQVALWCANWLEQSSPSLPRLGIVAPDIEAIQSELTWALDETLAQRFGQASPLNLNRQTLYNISLGQSLTQLPLVQNALQTLQMGLMPQQPLQYEEWSNWLISPYTVGDLIQRQNADSVLRRMQWSRFKWPKLLETLHDRTQVAGKTHPLPKALRQVLQQQAAVKRAHQVTLPAFAQAAVETLHAFHWAQGSIHSGEQSRALSTIEMQQKEAFLQALSQFSNSYFQVDKQSFSSWLSLLKQFLSTLLHQPQTESWVPIQIMGMLEASGQSFDALWVMGLTDEAWPRMPKPNPFLPNKLQRDLGMPRCDATRELNYAQQITQRLAQAALDQVWSYPAHEQDSERLPSPLLATLIESQPAWPSYSRQPYQTLAARLKQQAEPLQWVADTQAPPLPLDSLAPGGTGILSAQSKCPLMAFIDYRLGARRQLEVVEEGLQPNHLGTLVHVVLEQFWLEMKTQSNLLVMEADALAQRVDELLAVAMQPLQNQADEAYLALEKQRIQALILDWLDLEKQRPAFAVVATESEHILEIGGLKFQTKLDRVDALEDFSGQRLIMDYKTGRANAGDLLKEPIEAPQLAVYLHAFAGDEVIGLGYGILHSDDGVKLDFVLAEDGILPKSRSQKVFSQLASKANGAFEGLAWEDFIQALRDEVTDLASRLQQGDAAMTFRRESDLQYAAGGLALRLPEAKWQGVGVCQEEACE